VSVDECDLGLLLLWCFMVVVYLLWLIVFGIICLDFWCWWYSCCYYFFVGCRLFYFVVLCIVVMLLFYYLSVIFIVTPKIEGVRKNIWEVLVGAFSDFGGLDTDNPVQIWGYFRNFEVNLESVGLI